MAKRIQIYRASSTSDNEIFFNQVVETLSNPQKSIPGKYAYGGAGTELWFEMLEDPNYYLLECQLDILKNKWRDILTAIGSNEFNLIDLGAGDGKKVKNLLDGALKMGMKPSYIGVDICDESNDLLEKQMQEYSKKIDVTILTSTYEQAAQWIRQNKPGNNVYTILGSTIGNFSDKELRYSFNEGQFFFIGCDLVKNPTTITKAYSQPNYPIKGSPQGIINVRDHLGGSLGPQCFYPHLIYDPIDATIKDFMISKRQQVLKIRDREFHLKKNQPILVFFSKKREIQELEEIVKSHSLKLVENFEDSKNYYSCALFKIDRSE